MAIFRHFCDHCKTAFTADTPARRYCSGKCRLQARHDRAIKRYEAENETSDAQ